MKKSNQRTLGHISTALAFICNESLFFMENFDEKQEKILDNIITAFSVIVQYYGEEVLLSKKAKSYISELASNITDDALKYMIPR